MMGAIRATDRSNRDTFGPLLGGNERQMIGPAERRRLRSCFWAKKLKKLKKLRKLRKLKRALGADWAAGAHSKRRRLALGQRGSGTQQMPQAATSVSAHTSPIGTAVKHWSHSDAQHNERPPVARAPWHPRLWLACFPSSSEERDPLWLYKFPD